MTSSARSRQLSNRQKMAHKRRTESRIGGCGLAEIELHLGRILRTRGGGKIRLIVEIKHAGIQNGGERFDGGVILLNRSVEIPAFEPDAILGAVELSLQF